MVRLVVEEEHQLPENITEVIITIICNTTTLHSNTNNKLLIQVILACNSNNRIIHTMQNHRTCNRRWTQATTRIQTVKQRTGNRPINSVPPSR